MKNPFRKKDLTTGEWFGGWVDDQIALIEGGPQRNRRELLDLVGHATDVAVGFGDITLDEHRAYSAILDRARHAALVAA